MAKNTIMQGISSDFRSHKQEPDERSYMESRLDRNGHQ